MGFLGPVQKAVVTTRAGGSSLTARRIPIMTNINKGINFVMYCAGLLVTGTGLALAWKFPHGSQRQGITLLGLSPHEWGDIHLWAGVFLAAAIVVHLILHWRWIWQVASKRVPWKAWVGIALPMIACLGLLALPMDQPDRRMAEAHSELNEPSPAQTAVVSTDESSRPHHSVRGKDRHYRSGRDHR